MVLWPKRCQQTQLVKKINKDFCCTSTPLVVLIVVVLVVVIWNWKSHWQGLPQLSATDTKLAEQYINLDKVTFYDFDRRGHWVGNQFLPSSPSTPSAQLTMAD